MAFNLLAPTNTRVPNPSGLSNLNQALPALEGMLLDQKPIGIIYLDIAKFGQLEGDYGQETFDEIFSITSDVLKGFSGSLFRRDDMLLISEDLGDVFILVFSNTRSVNEITPEVLQGICQNIQTSLNEEIKNRLNGLIEQKIGYFAGFSILYPDVRIHPQRQIYRAVKQASRMSFDKQNDEFEKKISNLRGLIRGNHLVSFFQPIVSFDPCEILGHELLTRGPNGRAIMDSEVMFRIAEQGGLALDLERAARNKAVESLQGKKLPGKIFLNNGPNVIMAPDFADLLIYERMGWDPSRVVIELTEGEAIKNLREIKSRLEIFRREGCQIAVDDVGKGNSGLFLLTELKPEFAKIDMTLVRDIDKEELKQRLIEKLVEFGHSSNTRFIAEGIETVREYEALIKLGVKYGQGFLFGVPNPDPHKELEWLPDSKEKV